MRKSRLNSLLFTQMYLFSGNFKQSVYLIYSVNKIISTTWTQCPSLYGSVLLSSSESTSPSDSDSTISWPVEMVAAILQNLKTHHNKNNEHWWHQVLTYLRKKNTVYWGLATFEAKRASVMMTARDHFCGFVWFLAHLSTKRSGWAIVTGLCSSSSVVLRMSCINIFT